MTQIAALYVETDGAYFGVPGVDAWDEVRDARSYAGPHPVVAHPPCQRWGKMWFGQPLTVKRTGVRKKLGDDGGCFAAALDAVRTFGGVLEHPWGSQAWAVVARMGLERAKRLGEVGARGGGTDSTARIHTPVPFRDLLISIAATARPATVRAA